MTMEFGCILALRYLWNLDSEEFLVPPIFILLGVRFLLPIITTLSLSWIWIRIWATLQFGFESELEFNPDLNPNSAI
uniref:Uncharacterized protein n=1 Tax=Acrobeloides nanus TaxID=290746 RepID=A0A914DH56_9BILA